MKLQEAIEQGYTHAVSEGCESAVKLTNILEYPDHYTDVPYLLCDKKPYAFSISADTMSDLVQRHLEEQEEVYDSSEKIFDEAAQADYEEIVAILNKYFKPRFFRATDIELEIPLNQ